VVTGHAAGPVAVVRRDDLYVRLLEARGISPLPRHPADHPMEER
jgi:hypothetical protein